MENIQEEAILGMLSEINKKVDKVVSIVKTDRTLQSAERIAEPSPSITKEEIDTVTKNYAQQLENIIGKKHKENLEKLDCFPTELSKLNESVKNIPKPKNISFEPIIELFPKQKKIAFFGFEFLRTSVVIFALALFLCWSAIMNIKQMDKHKALIYQLSEQTEYIRQMQTNNEKQKEVKDKSPVKKKK